MGTGINTGTPMGGKLERTRGHASIKTRARQDQDARAEATRLESMPLLDHGTTDEQRRLVDVFGPKVRTLEWSDYIAATRVRPWSLDATRAHQLRTDRRIMQPRTRTTGPQLARNLDRLARLVQDGTITATDYFAMIAALEVDMTPAEHAQQVTR